MKCTKCGEAFTARRADGDFLDGDDARPPKPTLKVPGIKARPKPSRDEVEEVSPPPRKANKPAAKADDEDVDDAPRPKKKGKNKKKKKQAGSPVMLYVLVGIGAFLLLGGGGIGIYYGFIHESESKPTTPSAKGGTTGSSGPAPRAGNPVTSGWIVVDERDGGFHLSFPKEPKKEIKSEDSPPFGQLETTTYLHAGDGELFLSQYVKLPTDRKGLTDEQILVAIFQDAQKKGLEQNAEMKDFRKTVYQSFPACEFSFTAMTEKGSLKFFARFVLAKDRVISLLSAGAVPSSHAPRSKAFFDSLKID